MEEWIHVKVKIKSQIKIKMEISVNLTLRVRCASMEWPGYSAVYQPSCYTGVTPPALKRGAPVLRYASPALQEDKTLVSFLVWSNPTNLCWASPALQADAEVVGAALSSPFYAEQFTE